jgi:hypothetical protein
VSGLPVCWFCGLEVDPASDRTYHRVEAWERPAHTRPSGKHGGSDLALRVRVEGVAHDSCVQLERQGVSVGQETLI